MSTSETNPQTSQEKPFTVLLMVIALVLIVGGVYIYYLRSKSASYHLLVCQNNQGRLALAAINYATVRKTLPARVFLGEDGEPLHSWRTFVLPFCEQQEVYESIDFKKAWDDPANVAAFEREIDILHCPLHGIDKHKNNTTYFAVTAPDSVWENRPLDVEDIPDGDSNTLLFLELDLPGIHWMEPKDVSLDELLAMLKKDGKLPSLHDEGVNMAFADVSVVLVPHEKITPAFLKAIVSIDGGEEIPELEQLRSKQN